jgi:23S rRNA pseudouridine2457 synthase
MIVLFNKPFGVLTQFTDSQDRLNLSNFINIKGLYPAGRLDKDSEGLLVLTDDGRMQHLISDPKHKLTKIYWVQVENLPTEQALERLRRGVALKDGLTAPARVHKMEPPSLWPRDPPVRYRAKIPTGWLEIGISEGRNRQVRRMTATVGYPTLRLVRVAIGPWRLDDLAPGQWREVPLDPAQFPAHWRKILSSPVARRQRSGSGWGNAGNTGSARTPKPAKRGAPRQTYKKRRKHGK